MSNRLTAEQVRDAIFNGLGMQDIANELKVQAITDELNAALDDVEELENKYVELCELVREMWTYTQVANVNGKLSDDAAWNACEFESRLRKLGVL